MKLYEITNAIAKLDDTIDDPETLKQYLDGVNMQLQEKAKNLFMYIKNVEAPVEAIDKEIERLQTMKIYYQKKANNLKEYISYNMQKAKVEKIETDIVRFSFRKADSVDIFDEAAIPSKFLKEVKRISVDKTAIKKAIKGGEEVNGASIVTNKHLQIK